MTVSYYNRQWPSYHPERIVWFLGGNSKDTARLAQMASGTLLRVGNSKHTHLLENSSLY